MHWWYFLILFGAVAYFGYRRYIDNKRRKQAAAPKCETCGSPMELQAKQGDSEIWTCPKCSPGE
jgi:ribosomal protein L37AE/L43A